MAVRRWRLVGRCPSTGDLVPVAAESERPSLLNEHKHRDTMMSTCVAHDLFLVPGKDDAAAIPLPPAPLSVAHNVVHCTACARHFNVGRHEWPAETNFARHHPPGAPAHANSRLCEGTDAPIGRVESTEDAQWRRDTDRSERRELALGGLLLLGLVAGLVWGGVALFGGGDSDEPSAAADGSSLVDDSSSLDGSGSSGDSSGTSGFDVDALSTDQRVTYLVTLRGVEPYFEDEPDDALLALGGEVCESLQNGNSRETVIEALAILANGSERTTARLIVAADMYLC